MTDETRAELRRGIEAVVRASASDVDDDCVHVTNVPVSRGAQDNIIGRVVSLRVRTATVDSSTTPPLTPFQQMCLAGLLGDPGQLEAAVADWCLENGVDAVTAAYERGKRDGNPFSKAADALEEFGRAAYRLHNLTVPPHLIGDPSP